jgi:hypothetical protein
MSLTICEILHSAPELKVAMIDDDLEGLRQIFKIYMPILECFCDSKHFTVIDLVVAFGFIHGL